MGYGHGEEKEVAFIVIFGFPLSNKKKVPRQYFILLYNLILDPMAGKCIFHVIILLSPTPFPFL